ncbi:unnamed protein product [Linum trigynum]|uniref:DUF538 domain-containing protein n=1 Tax=Linum trigynum TaxID=586398 RepID=A0AAV2CAR2_9ROSI
MAALRNPPTTTTTNNNNNFPLLLCLFLSITTAAAAAAKAPTIYDYLNSNGLPIGLFPEGITNFSLDSATGRFQINLTQPCNVKLENQLHYDFNISGLLSPGKIQELSGMSQQELFLWFPVKGIRVDDPKTGLIHFDVGVVDKQFTFSMFEIPGQCIDGGEQPSQSSDSYWFQERYENQGVLRADS